PPEADRNRRKLSIRRAAPFATVEAYRRVGRALRRDASLRVLQNEACTPSSSVARHIPCTENTAMSGAAPLIAAADSRGRVPMGRLIVCAWALGLALGAPSVASAAPPKPTPHHAAKKPQKAAKPPKAKKATPARPPKAAAPKAKAPRTKPKAGK